MVYSDLLSHSYQTRLQAQAAGVAYSHPLGDLTSRMACFGPNMVRVRQHFVPPHPVKTFMTNINPLNFCT